MAAVAERMEVSFLLCLAVFHFNCYHLVDMFLISEVLSAVPPDGGAALVPPSFFHPTALLAAFGSFQQHFIC